MDGRGIVVARVLVKDPKYLVIGTFHYKNGMKPVIIRSYSTRSNKKESVSVQKQQGLPKDLLLLAKH